MPETQQPPPRPRYEPHGEHFLRYGRLRDNNAWHVCEGPCGGNGAFGPPNTRWCTVCRETCRREQDRKLKERARKR